MPKNHGTARLQLLATAFAVISLVVACSNHAQLDQAAPNVSFKTLNSAKPIELSELGRPLLVSFWSTTCVICIKEMPHLASLYEEFKPKGFEMVAVAMPFDRPSDVVEFSEAGQWPFIVALDFDESVTKSFGDIRLTPTAFLIDQDGILIEKYVGAIDLKKFRDKLETLTSNS